MQITINKTELAGALAALGKLVSRTSLIKTYQAIQIEGKANMLYFRTRNKAEGIEFRLFADMKRTFRRCSSNSSSSVLLFATAKTKP